MAMHGMGGDHGSSGRKARDPSTVAFARMHKSIGSLLHRIQATEAKYGDASAAGGSAAGGRAPGGAATRLTMRAGVLLRGGRRQRARVAGAAAAAHAHPRWTAPVDLNPGISFRPGSPQRVMAVAPELGCALVARSSGLHCLVAGGMGEAAADLALAGLTHRERLQAGIQQLNAEFYASLQPAA